MSLHFSSPGSPLSTPSPGGSVKGLEQAAKLGITALELEWVQRVPMGIENAEKIAKKADELGITLTVHAPYFVNLNAKEREKLAASKKRILDALMMAEICGAKSVCVHPAFYLGINHETVFENVRKATDDIMKKKKKLAPNVNLAYETMGKQTQFGTLDELLRLSKEFGIYPCVDFAHIHARENGKQNSKSEWNILLDTYAKILGKKSLKNVHFHYSGINYGEKGERNHVPLQESDAKWKVFVRVLKERNIGGVIVIESPIGEEDVMLMKKEYERCSCAKL